MTWDVSSKNMIRLRKALSKFYKGNSVFQVAGPSFWTTILKGHNQPVVDLYSLDYPWPGLKLTDYTLHENSNFI